MILKTLVGMVVAAAIIGGVYVIGRITSKIFKLEISWAECGLAGLLVCMMVGLALLLGYHIGTLIMG